jgi:hypothetical protein
MKLPGGKTIAISLKWVGKSKLRRFAGWLVFLIIFDRLFGYVVGWPRHSWTETVFFGLGMALWFSVLSVFGWQKEIDI